MGDSQAIQSGSRNPAIELYRVLLMFLIVFYHSIMHGLWSPCGNGGLFPTPFLANILCCLVIWHVDGFLSITGWFGTRFTLVKFSKLWGIITAYSVVCVVHECLTKGRLSGKCFAGGWFGFTYLFFMFIIPILNAALEFLSHDKRKLYLAWIILDCGAFLNWALYRLLSSVCGSGAGAFSIMTFIVIYLNVRLLKISGLHEKVSKKMIVLAAGMFLGVIMVFAFSRILVRMFVRGVDWCWGDFLGGIGFYSVYNAPHVMLMAIALLLLFAKFVKVPCWLAGIVMRISPLMLGVYIIHDTTTFGRQIYRLPQEWMANNLGWHPLVVILMTAIWCFAVCVAIESARRWLSAPFVKWIMPKIQRLDKKIGL